jgi:phenylpropionate dioxygenase-like ring-hydroxylating dioxygenase large terminal subunit
MRVTVSAARRQNKVRTLGDIPRCAWAGIRRVVPASKRASWEDAVFEGFAQVWTPVTLASRLKDKPLPVELAGERLVLFRGQGGKAAALIDRCPHRGVKLSLGKITANGCLECPFHAWQFDGQGRAQHIPLNPDAKKERLFAQAVPVRELGGLLWAYTAVGEEAPHEPTVPETLTMPGLARTFFEEEWDAHWSRAMENMLDSPHVPFVHRTTIGRSSSRTMTRDSRMEITVEDTPYGFRQVSSIDQVDNHAWLDFYKPDIMVLHIPIPGKIFRMHAICVPVNATRVRMIIVGARNFAALSLLNPFFAHSNKVIARQDRAVVESSQPKEVPVASEEVSVRTDKATLQFRKYYQDVLKPSSSPVPERHGRLAQA